MFGMITEPSTELCRSWGVLTWASPSSAGGAARLGL